MTHSYERKTGVEHSEILAPENAPAWATNRQELWNRVDAAEKRKDARTAKELLVALPRELTPAQQVELVRDFARTEFVNRGLVVDFSIHAPDALDGGKQPHAHIMTTTRAIEGDGWAKAKDRTLDHTDGIEAIRERWAHHANLALERAGLGERVDHRSLADQKAAAIERGDEVAVIVLDRPPEPKIGPVALHLVKTGREDQAHAWRDVKAVREQRSRLGQVVDFVKAARDLIQSRAERLAPLANRLERAVEGLRQRAALSAFEPPRPTPEPTSADLVASYAEKINAEAERIHARLKANHDAAQARYDGAVKAVADHRKTEPQRPTGLTKEGLWNAVKKKVDGIIWEYPNGREPDNTPRMFGMRQYEKEIAEYDSKLRDLMDKTSVFGEALRKNPDLHPLHSRTPDELLTGCKFYGGLQRRSDDAIFTAAEKAVREGMTPAAVARIDAMKAEGQRREAEEKRQKAVEQKVEKAVKAFQDLAAKRQAGRWGYTDTSSTWKALPASRREQVEQFNALPKADQAKVLDRMRADLRKAPEKAESLTKQLSASRGRGLSL